MSCTVFIKPTVTLANEAIVSPLIQHRLTGIDVDCLA